MRGTERNLQTQTKTWCLSKKRDGQTDRPPGTALSRKLKPDSERCVLLCLLCGTATLPSFSKRGNWVISFTVAIYQKEHLKSSSDIFSPSLCYF